jgi:hypothetical protein
MDMSFPELWLRQLELGGSAGVLEVAYWSDAGG